MGLSLGRECSQLTSENPCHSTFYVKVIEHDFFSSDHVPSIDIFTSYLKGKKVLTKNPLIYHSPTLISINSDGFVAESPEHNFIIYTGDKRLLVPTFDKMRSPPHINRFV